ncbi:hypothetical protein BBK36DRAFT_1177319 [Trichoderma citrinoviride]|uniref:Uncharacterized protein n=1 Tax=Trichoderma citrinoviride TaxID=58853 RepID=A0A2T4B685_9HYPO|nr:hypothetical protein BBK36DRAFT_1177319 [Trichoderma citrinoviride]PTB64749.1 hypothetical protein BBK36DRAFT_1177319 [Trichoderma citrinoviride]
MSHRPDSLTGPVAEGIGIRFLNEEWNDSISNGHLFTIKWNESLDEARSPELGLFKITYPRDGDVVYELVSNLTDGIDTANSTCSWTPNHLSDELYTLWLSSSQDARSNWTTSPPWRLKEHNQSRHPSRRWAAPVVIPILVMLTVYTLGLTVCMVYRRHRNARRERESSEEGEAEKEDAEPPGLLGDADRHPSVDTAITLTDHDSEEVKKPHIWLLTQSASGSLLLASPGRKHANSDATLVSPTLVSPTLVSPTLVSPTSLSSEPLLVSPISLAEQSPTNIRYERTFIALADPRDHRAVVASRLGRSLRVIIPSDDVRE